MVQLEVTIQMAEPFLIGGRKPAFITETLEYLPGSALRGVVAETLLRKWPLQSRRVPHPDECPNRNECDFCRLFYPQTGLVPRFGNLYPSSGDVARPFPLTARTCKYHPGFFRPQSVSEERHGIFDILIRQYAFEMAIEAGKRLPFVYLQKCPQCRAKAEPVTFLVYNTLEDICQAPRLLHRRITRTAISRSRGAAREQQLFTLNVLSELMDTDLLEENGAPIREITTLKGHVWVAEDSAEAMTEALGQVERIGAVRSRGLGRVAGIGVEPVTPVKSRENTALFLEQAVVGNFFVPEDREMPGANANHSPEKDLAERLLAFNARFQAERDFYARLGIPLPEYSWYFTLDLLSDVILFDDGLPTLAPTPEMLKLDGDAIPKVRLLRSFVRHGYRSGWSGAHGLPRQTHLAALMGGVYLFGVESGEHNAVGRLLERLESLERNGVGLERERGFGHVMICQPFHLEIEPR